jgi:hypothetical protein
MANITFCKPFIIKLPLTHEIIKTSVIILENRISLHKPILDSGKFSVSRISTLTTIATTKKKNNELGLVIVMSKIMINPGQNNELMMSQNLINNEPGPFLN